MQKEKVNDEGLAIVFTDPNDATMNIQFLLVITSLKVEL